MISLHPVASSRTRSKPLAACIAALCGLSASTAMATGTIWDVTDCSDNGGPGTLRAVINAAANGDTVNLSSLSCSTITLAAGNTAIPVQWDNLRIQTSGNDHITIDGSALKSGVTSGNASRIFSHLGTGTLTLQGVTLTGGHVYPLAVGAYGGCIRSAGNVELINSTVTSCSAKSAAAAASKLKVYGGGIFASGNVTLTNSTVSGNSATSTNYSVKGGGIFATGNVQATHSVISGNYGKGGGNESLGGGINAKNGSITLSYSTVSGNTLKSMSADHGAYGGGTFSASAGLTASYSTISGNSVWSNAGYAAGGAIFAQRNVTLRKATISGNYSSAALGGIAALSSGGTNTNTFYMIASTVSGNSAGGLVGGIGVDSATTKIYNSTIAFNTASGATASEQVYGPGLALNAIYVPMSVTLSSNLLSNNTYDAGIEADLTTANSSTHAITFNASPANNFIRTSYVPAAAASQLPGDTLSGSCPLLGLLRDNGGPTHTHALLSGSIAIDLGNNAKNLTEDQRGVLADAMPFKYPLPSGAAADMGAYEVTQADIVFNGAFDGCPALP